MSKRGKSKRVKKRFEKNLLSEGGIQNVELAIAMIGLRSSNAAQPHIPKSLRGSRGVKNRDSIKDSLNY